MSYSSCYATSAIDLGCASNVGGVKTIYVVPVITGTTEATSPNDGVITNIAGSGTIYEFSVQKQTSSLTETLNSSLENGTTFFQQDLIAVFHKMDADKRHQLKLLSTNRGISLVVQDNNDTFFLLGEDFDGGFMSASSNATGTAFGDRNGYEVTFTTYSKDPMKTCSGATINDFVTGYTVVESN